MRKEKPVQYRGIVSADEKDVMFSVMIRNPDVFTSFKDILLPKSFADCDPLYAVVCEVARKLHAEHGELPARGTLMAAVAAAIEQDPEAIAGVDESDLEIFIDKAFDDHDAWKADLSTSPKYAQWATAFLKKYCEERFMANLHRNSTAHAQILADIPGFFQNMQTELEKIRCIGGPQAQSFLPRKGDWDKQGGIGIFPTGLKFFDKLLNGGHAPKEVYGTMGPFGSCKTTLAVMLAVEACKQAAEVYKKTGKMEYVFFVSYEAPLVNELRFRAISYAAQIRRDSLEKMDPKLGRKSLSTHKTLKKYEKKLFGAKLAEGEPVLGEQERLNGVIDMLDRHMIVLDMSGADPARRSAGSGYVEEIAAAITTELHRRGPGVKARIVVVDYVGAMCSRTRWLRKRTRVPYGIS